MVQPENRLRSGHRTRTYGTNNHSKSNYRNIVHWIRSNTSAVLASSRSSTQKRSRLALSRNGSLELPREWMDAAGSATLFDLRGKSLTRVSPEGRVGLPGLIDGAEDAVLMVETHSPRTDVWRIDTPHHG